MHEIVPGQDPGAVSLLVNLTPAGVAQTYVHRGDLDIRVGVALVISVYRLDNLMRVRYSGRVVPDDGLRGAKIHRDGVSFGQTPTACSHDDTGVLRELTRVS